MTDSNITLVTVAREYHRISDALRVRSISDNEVDALCAARDSACTRLAAYPASNLRELVLKHSVLRREYEHSMWDDDNNLLASITLDIERFAELEARSASYDPNYVITKLAVEYHRVRDAFDDSCLKDVGRICKRLAGLTADNCRELSLKYTVMRREDQYVMTDDESLRMSIALDIIRLAEREARESDAIPTG